MSSRPEPDTGVIMLEKEDQLGRQRAGATTASSPAAIIPADRQILLFTREADETQLDLLAARAAANSVEMRRLDAAGLAGLDPLRRTCLTPSSRRSTAVSLWLVSSAMTYLD
jgi:hypothetical protein